MYHDTGLFTIQWMPPPVGQFTLGSQKWAVCENMWNVLAFMVFLLSVVGKISENMIPNFNANLLLYLSLGFTTHLSLVGSTTTMLSRVPRHHDVNQISRAPRATIFLSVTECHFSLPCHSLSLSPSPDIYCFFAWEQGMILFVYFLWVRTAERIYTTTYYIPSSPNAKESWPKKNLEF